jgi:hypothetical protein
MDKTLFNQIFIHFPSTVFFLPGEAVNRKCKKWVLTFGVLLNTQILKNKKTHMSFQ